MEKEQKTIPFFIPFLGCPEKCVFCDQNRITGSRGDVKPEEVPYVIERNLATIDPAVYDVEVGFFGGTFTALPESSQEAYLSEVAPFLKRKAVRSIRVSTRPDAINDKVLRTLERYGVRTVELGVQSMSDRVLAASRRGHGSAETEEASRLIVKKGFRLGHQIMLGMPESGEDDEYHTARKVLELGASDVRIYPVLVIKGTALADLWASGVYLPLSEEEALRRTVLLLIYFAIGKVSVIRCGLHPSEGLLTKEECLAGPFHPAFRAKAESIIFSELLSRSPVVKGGKYFFNPKDDCFLRGHGGLNGKIIHRLTASGCALIGDEKAQRGGILFVNGGGVFIGKESLADMLPEGLRP